MDEIENKEIINENELNDIGDEIPLLKPKRKMKKYPRTEKQQEAFKLIMQKRAENGAKRKEQKKMQPLNYYCHYNHQKKLKMNQLMKSLKRNLNQRKN